MILGILFISYSSRGHQLVFSYPPTDDSLKSRPASTSHHLSTELADKSDTFTRSRTHSSQGHHTSSSGAISGVNGNSNSRHHEHTTPILGLDATFLSDLLSPKSSLCDKQFHLRVGNIDFLGHPTLLNADRPGTGLRFTRQIQKTKLSRSAYSGTLDEATLMERNSIVSTSFLQSPPLPMATFVGGSVDHNTNAEARMEAFTSPLAGTLDNKTVLFPEHQFKPPSRAKNDPSLREPKSTPSQPKGNLSTHLTMFHLVLALQSPTQDDITDLYEHVIVQVTAALKYEQLRRGYIKNETELILSLKEELSTKDMAPSAITDAIIQSSSLAKTLVAVYHGVSNDTRNAVHLEVNSSVLLSVQRSLSHVKLTRNLGAHGFSSEEQRLIPRFRPYHTLLLLSDPEITLRQLPVDVSPLLIELIQVVSPMHSFDELQATLNCSLAQIYRLAAHLFYWGAAKVIDAVSARNVYVTAPHAPLRRIKSLDAEFNSRFKVESLENILCQLSSPKPLSTLIPSKSSRVMYLEIATFLLRHDLIIQLHVYLYLVLPSEKYLQDTTAPGHKPPSLQKQHSHQSILSTSNPFEPASNYGNDSARSLSQQRMASSLFDASINYSAPQVITNSDQMGPLQDRYLRTILSQHPASVSSLFLRIMPHLDGQKHVDEIMFRENIPRKEMNSFIKKFSGLLITTSFGST